MEYSKQQVKADCEELLRRFQLTDSVSGTKTGAEQRAFSRQVLAVACSYLLPPFTFQIRVGGLYLLYALYSCQLSMPKEQIHVALKDWGQIKSFEQDAANAQHFDAVYIFRLLMSQKAFYYSAMPYSLTYQVKRKKSRQSVCAKFVERACRPQELVSGELLEELSIVHKHYQQLKAAISKQPGRSDPLLNLIHQDLVPQLHNSVVEFNRWQKERNAPLRGEEDIGEGTSVLQGSSRRAELLASIKLKSYGQAIEAAKSRRHRQVQIEFMSDETKPTNKMSGQKEKKTSLRERTNKNVQIKGELKEETFKVTKLWRLSTPDSTPEEVPRKIRKFKW